MKDPFNDKDIAIIGISCRFPDAGSYHQYWDNLRNGRNSIREIPIDRWDTEEYYSSNVLDNEKSVSKWCGIVEGIDQF
ncbi:MAG: hypothetical protein MJE63_06895, partial [Proteobacteria bacterium]|nr:hypothetical protein [Pseudomonadota bacterium]